METNIAKLCYVGAKMTININSPLVISVQTNATKSRYVGAKTTTKLLNLAMITATQLHHETIVKPEASQS